MQDFFAVRRGHGPSGLMVNMPIGPIFSPGTLIGRPIGNSLVFIAVVDLRLRFRSYKMK